jgi:hypothetical protein
LEEIFVVILLLALVAPVFAQSDDYNRGVRDFLKAGWDVTQALNSGDQSAYSREASAWNNMAQTYLGPEYILNVGASGSSAASAVLPGSNGRIDGLTNIPIGAQVALPGRAKRSYGPFMDDTWKPNI